jgi:ferredoxin
LEYETSAGVARAVAPADEQAMIEVAECCPFGAIQVSNPRTSDQVFP